MHPFTLMRGLCLALVAQGAGVFVAPRWIRMLGWIATALVVSASLWFVAGAFS